MKSAKILKRFRIDDPDRFRLARFDPADTGGLDLDKDEAKAMLADDIERLVRAAGAALRRRTAGRCWSCCRRWTPPARTASSST